MKLKMTLLTVAGALAFLLQPAFSRGPLRPPHKNGIPNQQVNFRSACTTAQAQIDQDINNVRARLLTGGDIWWDRSDGKYVVPKPQPGQPEVSAIFAAGIWLGGFDDGGNLKMACQTYGNNGSSSDFWPGPLSQAEGATTLEVCNNWDRFFEVKGTEIREHLQKWQSSGEGGIAYTLDQIPASVKMWPAKGNPYFYQNYLFHLPNNDQGLAPFYDQNGDGNYQPLDGDFPTLETRGCNDNPTQFPDQMIFWMYNDEGGGAIHGETSGIPIRMEVHATAFAYSTFDQINDMTFQQHKFINRAKEDIDSFHFALWVDPDLGCHLDDYIGCAPGRNMAYWFNADAEDGQPGITCDGVPTYGTDIPAVGIDIFRGPLDENGNELGMSSFMYYNNTIVQLPGGTIDPSTDVEFYRYMTGSWKDGTRLTYGGDGYDPTNTDPANRTNFAFPSVPDDPNGWSMCYPGPEFPNGLPAYDRHIVQSCGPMILQPGAVNELTFGVVYAPDLEYPCPDMSKLFIADDLAQNLFDNCIEFTDGPDAPEMDWIALDQEIIGVLSNKPAPASNNSNESYEELVFGHPAGVTDSTYNFEGYLVYQLAGPEVRWNDLLDVKKARLVFQTDVKNGVNTLVNWEAVPNPTYNPAVGGSYLVYQPKMVVEGADEGIRHSFRITDDQFAQGDRRLINHRKYYFVALAYASNNFETFDPLLGTGQQKMFVIGRQNIGPDGDGLPYSVLPRPIVDKNSTPATAMAQPSPASMGWGWVAISWTCRMRRWRKSWTAASMAKSPTSEAERPSRCRFSTHSTCRTASTR
ncbi:MAG: hypothetical protein IPM82_27670 [Saprospiraceae bacterium]|nr:hypothetical protein [Saprospiraceae bacterium]